MRVSALQPRNHAKNSSASCRTNGALETLRGMRRSAADQAVSVSFSEFMEATEPSVRRALISGYGSRLGREATLEAFE